MSKIKRGNGLEKNDQWKSRPKKFQQHWQCNNLLLGYGPLQHNDN
jgi:hypothetical protein